jgi:hypothetical protein
MGKPTSDNGIPRPCEKVHKPDHAVRRDLPDNDALRERRVVSDFRYHKEV